MESSSIHPSTNTHTFFIIFFSRSMRFTQHIKHTKENNKRKSIKRGKIKGKKCGLFHIHRCDREASKRANWHGHVHITFDLCIPTLWQSFYCETKNTAWKMIFHAFFTILIENGGKEKMKTIIELGFECWSR